MSARHTSTFAREDQKADPPSPGRCDSSFGPRTARHGRWRLRYALGISNRYRSEFLGEVAGFGNGRTLRQVEPPRVCRRPQLLRGRGHDKQDDEQVFTYENGDQRRIIDHQVYGRTYLFGLNYRY